MFKLISINEYKEAWLYVQDKENFGRPMSRQRFKYMRAMLNTVRGVFHYPEIDTEEEWGNLLANKPQVSDN